MYSGIAERTGSLLGLLFIVGPILGQVGCAWPIEARGQTLALRESQSQPSPQSARDDDKKAIQAVMESFRKAFEARDAKALAEHWTAEGEYSGAGGQKAQGRDALTKGFQAFFARTPEVTSKVEHDGIRFLSSNSAIDEGTVTVRRGAVESATSAKFSALFVREDGKWRLAQLTESEPDPDSISDLAWLVGNWSSQGKEGAEIRTVYSWHANKKFIIGDFTIKEKDRSFNGTQVIGVDPKSGAIHSWTFEASGGVGEADWRRDGDHWVLDVSGRLPDGSELTETNVLRRVNDRTFTWQSVNRSLGETSLDDLAPVKVSRVEPAR
jgi:uncharacterized protein (TIGR02246 family)